jgi:hypothetical protein
MEAELELIHYRLIRTTKRLTFDIIWQHPETKWYGDDDGEYYIFKASNGYEVISRSVMDIQTERVWLLGASQEDRAFRSGSMVFGTNEKRDKAFDNFRQAILEWNYHWLDKMKAYELL